jgi:osmotically-inducible protein OsmY
VHSAEEKAQAETIAQQIDGVKGVRAVKADLRLATATN